MPGRDIKFINGGIYHIYNKTIDKRTVFQDDSLKVLFLELIKYYRSSKSVRRYSNYKNLPEELEKIYNPQILDKKHFFVEIYCYSIMPTHFHLLLKQIMNGGVSRFLSQILNSFTRFFNIKFNHSGPIFLRPFKAVEVRTEEQCKHVSRYIHLNEYSSGLISDSGMILNSDNSSFPRYLNRDEDTLVDKSFILNLFSNSWVNYKKFVLDQADYQKSLERFKYTEKWR